MKHINFFAVIILSAFAIVSCSKKKYAGTTNSTASVKTASNIMGDTILGLNSMGIPYGSGKYTFFSLENNVVIANSDSATNKWDIGFRGTTIITNSGNSGPGTGGAFIQTGTFETLTTISADSAFRVDNAPAAYAITVAPVKAGILINATANLITPIPGRILVIRTATGKYAKVEILNYYKGGVTPDAMSF